MPFRMRCLTIGCLLALTLALRGTPRLAEARQPGHVPRIGMIVLGAGRGTGPMSEAFYQGLRAHGYVVGETVIIEPRGAHGKRERLVELAAELVRLPVDLILAPGTINALAARQATHTIPIITVYVSDPVGNGLAASLARPGGNVTGIAWLFDDLGAKQLELLQAVVPGLSRVAILWHAGDPGQNVPRVRAMEKLAQSAGIALHPLGVDKPEDFDGAFAKIISQEAEALLVVGDPFIYRHRKQIADFAIDRKLPSAFSIRPFAEAGGLFAYAPSITDSYRRAAAYAHKILQGANPAELPIERPSKFELVINLKTADAIGITIPPHILFQATEVIR